MATMNLIKESNISAPGPEVDTRRENIPVTGASIHVRIFTPQSSMKTNPVVLYIQGGGWVIAGINKYDTSPASMAEKKHRSSF